MNATIAKEQRHESILLSLKKLGYLSRRQIQRLHRLGGDRNANRVLKELTPYVNCVRMAENVYYLNSEGRERVGSERAYKKTNQIEHYLMRNTLYIERGCPSTWKAEVKFAVENEVAVIADAMYTMAGTYFIVEVDYTQKMVRNREKISKYQRLIELGVFEKNPKFLWITTTEYRRKQLEKLCEGLDARIFTVSDFN